MNEPSPEDWKKVVNDWIIVTNRLRNKIGLPEQPLWVDNPTENDILKWKEINTETFKHFENQAYQEMEHRLSLERKKNNYFWYYIFFYVIFILIYFLIISFWSFA